MNKKKDLTNWFIFMDQQFKKIKKSHEKSKINNLLIKNDIDIIK